MSRDRPETDRSPSSPPVASPRQPLVWALMGHRAGDNEQLGALAAGLGWPLEIKRMVYRPTELVTNILLGPTLAGMVRRHSSPLAPPWPDLVLTAGRRNEPIARWIRERSGGKTRIVHVGRPWAALGQFDLIVTTPQYTLPVRGNVVHNELPLHRITPARLAEAAAGWRERLAHLPPPRIAVLVGGNSPPYKLDADAAERLGRGVSALTAQGGSLLVTTSARTGPQATAALQASLAGPAWFHAWQPAGSDNPYLAFLAVADAIVVTAESVSMATEASATGKPVYLFDPGRGWTSLRAPSGPASLVRGLLTADGQQILHGSVVRLLPARLRRNIGRMMRALVTNGRAAWLGDAPPSSILQPSADLDRAVTAVRGLFPDLSR